MFNRSFVDTHIYDYDISSPADRFRIAYDSYWNMIICRLTIHFLELSADFQYFIAFLL